MNFQFKKKLYFDTWIKEMMTCGSDKIFLN